MYVLLYFLLHVFLFLLLYLLGGAADKCGELKVGDELLAINDVKVRNLSRIETWSLMKKLPDGSISIHIHR